MSVKKGSEESRPRASISGATAEGELKRKRETPPTEPKPRKRHHPDVTIYERPVLSVGVRSPGNNKFYRIRALFDTGSQFFGLSERVVAKLKIPRVKRDVPWLIQDYRGRTDEDGGEAHTELTEFKVLDRKFCETFQIIESEGRTDHDMVIPFGWALETGLQIVELPGGQGWKEAFTKPPKPTLDLLRPRVFALPYHFVTLRFAVVTVVLHRTEVRCCRLYLHARLTRPPVCPFLSVCRSESPRLCMALMSH